eukprot:TRINITY_DN4321_c0_g3_i2.p1 TRINITY_DN4321_c0_g3~~TRINITY_DN4321_c0_g3_i2.p1  ORF type:complete len:500 (+),score=100.05 TRINITY_DN4321_c0_g3_i2:54-1553(+)
MDRKDGKHQAGGRHTHSVTEENDRHEDFFTGTQVKIFTKQLTLKHTSERPSEIVNYGDNISFIDEQGDFPERSQYRYMGAKIPGIDTLMEQDPVKYAKAKFQIIESGQVLPLILDYMPDDGQRTCGVHTVRADGLHYAFHGEYVRDADGRLEFLRNDVIAKQRSVFTYLVKKIGASLLSGKSIMNISLPIDIFEARSELVRNATCHGMAMPFLERAAQLTDPLEQMKLSLTAIIAKLHLNMEQRKPFNPILGETFQGFINGCPVYYEQISHHPPVMAYQVLGRDYRIEGTLELIGSASLNQMKGAFIGLERIVFTKTQNIIYLKFPKVNLEGLMYGKRLGHYISNMTMFDPKNRIYTKVRFDPEKVSMLNIFHKRKLLRDAFFGEITLLKPNFCRQKAEELRVKSDASIKAKPTEVEKVLAVVSGNVLDRIEIDKVEYWRLGKIIPYRLVESLNPLPSDCTYRQDGLHLLLDNIELAQKAKDSMEDQQRKDKKLRTATN